MKKCIKDITEIKAADGKLYVSAIFDCYDLSALGLVMGTNMKVELCIRTFREGLNRISTLERQHSS